MEKQCVAIQGGLGSFHHEAAKRLLGDNVTFVDKDHFRDVAKAVSNNVCDRGVIAIENSIAGAILPNYALISNYNLQITAEVYLPISMNLMAIPGTTISQISKVYSHPIALLQCDDFLSEHEHIQRIEYDDTAKSAKKVAEDGKKSLAAIGSLAAAELYDLEVLQRDIQTNKKSFTRFFLIQKKDVPPTEYDKISLRFTLPHTTGKLSNVLLQFTINQFNLTKIQSLPVIDSPWKYSFYIDLLVHDKELLNQTLAIIAHMTEDLEILGKYKNGNIKYIY